MAQTYNDGHLSRTAGFLQPQDLCQSAVRDLCCLLTLTFSFPITRLDSPLFDNHLLSHDWSPARIARSYTLIMTDCYGESCHQHILRQ